MLLKVKTVLSQDIRALRREVPSLEEGLQALNDFVAKSYGIQGFTMQYKDDEGDLVTIASVSDLEQALELAASQGMTLKVHIAHKGEESKEEVPPLAPEPEAKYGCFFADVKNKAEFRADFIALIQDFLVALRASSEEESPDVQQLLAQALAQHELVAGHPQLIKAMTFLPMVATHAQEYLVFLTAIDPTRVPQVVEKIIEKCGQGMGGGPCGGGMPPFLLPMMMRHFAHGFPGGHHGPMGGFPFPPHMRRGRFGGCGRRGHPGKCPFGRKGKCGRKGKSPRALGADIIESNLTLADDAVVLPEQVVVKTWRVKNTGTEDWPEGTIVTYCGKPLNALVDGASFPVAALKTGEEGEIAVVLKTPAQGGQYKCNWRLATPEGEKFGQCMRARVTVQGAESAPWRLECPCGASVLPSPAQDVYRGSTVSCDGCGGKNTGSDLVYHCADGRNQAHPQGWDLCAECAQTQIRQQLAALQEQMGPMPPMESVPESKVEEPVAEDNGSSSSPSVEIVASPAEIQQALQAALDEDSSDADIYEPLLAPADDDVDDDDREIVAMDDVSSDEEQAPLLDFSKQPAPAVEPVPEPEPEPIPEPVVEPEPVPEPYKFQEQLDCILGMGFETDEGVVKALLERHRGRTDAVVNALLG